MITLMLLCSSLFAADPAFDLPCRFHTGTDIESFGNCARASEDGELAVAARYRSRLSFDKKGLAGLWVNDRCYWIRKTGAAKKTLCFENGPDYFREGFARYVGNDGKMGFMDTKLKVRIPPRFDFVFPFEGGSARFCNGCKPAPDGEHTSMSGGDWGRIDKKGKALPAIR